MSNAKKIDVILPDAVVEPFVEMLAGAPVVAWSVATGLSGRTLRGHATPGLCDAAVAVICRSEDAGAAIAGIEAFVARYGGVATEVDAEGLNLG